MKVRATTQVTIAASPAAVFTYLKKPDYHFFWNPGLEIVEPSATLKLGASYRSVRHVLGKRLETLNHVTQFADNQELELENNTGLIHYRVRYSLQTKSGLTRLVCRTDVEAKARAFAFARPVLEMLAKRELQSDLQALKFAVEHSLK